MILFSHVRPLYNVCVCDRHSITHIDGFLAYSEGQIALDEGKANPIYHNNNKLY